MYWKNKIFQYNYLYHQNYITINAKCFKIKTKLFKQFYENFIMQNIFKIFNINKLSCGWVRKYEWSRKDENGGRKPKWRRFSKPKFPAFNVSEKVRPFDKFALCV